MHHRALFRVSWLSVLLLFPMLVSSARGDVLQVAVASNFTAVMKGLVPHFEEHSGHRVKLSFGSSGKIYAQIRNGAPFQVFLSADQDKPIALEQAGLSVAGSRFTYAIGALVLWSSHADFIDPSLTRLRSGNFNKLAFANPKVAPYGSAALEVLQALGLRDSTERQWVQGENIAQTYQFVASGNADLGFVALSQVMDKGHIAQGSSWVVPTELYSPIRQDAVLLQSAANSKAALSLLQYLRSEEARTIIHQYGYQTE
ncbi:molybdate ABC transporter substrate-binding protein [Ketobacter sp.]|uniref:molybdate ABC transporter substrate-binding protein n=1 Tax=Ketobacter sp. TaxID=2083498 RepID=UPI0025BEED91|nr:molybdate ABC transporter substrate-binding protein [Ketobacter sp.]